MSNNVFTVPGKAGSERGENVVTKKMHWGMGIGLVALAAAVPAHGAATNISVVASGNWNSDIWDGPDSDSLADSGFRPDSNSAIINSGKTVTLNDDNSGTPWTFSTYQGRDGIVNVHDGAKLTWGTSTGFIVQGNLSGTHTSTVTMDGGTLTANSADSKITVANNSNTTGITGIFTQSGGVVDLQQGSDLQLTLATGTAGGSGTYNLSGTGLLKIGGDLIQGTGTAAFNFTGGTLVHNGLLMNLANNGGKLAPGGDGTIGTALLKGTTGSTGAMVGVDYTQNSGTLSVDIGATGYDKLLGTGATSGSNNVVLNGALQINMLSGFTPAEGATFDIVTTAAIANSSIIDNALLSVVGLSKGSFSASVIDNPTGADTLRLTYSVPEPTSLAVLSIAGLGLLRRRRRD